MLTDRIMISRIAIASVAMAGFAASLISFAFGLIGTQIARHYNPESGWAFVFSIALPAVLLLPVLLHLTIWFRFRRDEPLPVPLFWLAIVIGGLFGGATLWLCVNDAGDAFIYLPMLASATLLVGASILTSKPSGFSRETA